MSSSIQASILAIGTELTTGQITNQNAAWLSKQLGKLSIPVVLHETVADDRGMILNALDRCIEVSSSVFTTGGLGPTTDDFTREVIAQWLNQPLTFHEDIWQNVCENLTRIGVPIVESHRRQCFFPKGAQILPNPEGTAAGFTCLIPGNSKKQIWVFPGPPREVQSVWDPGAQSRLKSLNPNLPKLQLLTWQCLGKGEAELGELTEKVLQGSGLKTGYRAHDPFVEIKVWCPESELNSQKPWLTALNEALSPWVITSQGEDLAQKLVNQLPKNQTIHWVDATSSGTLGSRIKSALKNKNQIDLPKKITLTTEWVQIASPELYVKDLLDKADVDTLTLILAARNAETTATCGLRQQNTFQIETFELPNRHMKSCAVELALQKWLKWITH